MRRFDLHCPDTTSDFGIAELRARLIHQQEWADAANQAATAGLLLGFVFGVVVALVTAWVF
jgi:hypothetical protein